MGEAERKREQHNLRVVLETLRMAPHPEAQWLVARLEDYLVNGKPVVNGNHRAAHRRELRNHHLRQAAALLPGTPWQRSEALAVEVKRFETVNWPQWKDGIAPPATASAVRAELFRARRYGPLPGSDVQLHTITSKNVRSDLGHDERE